MSETQPTNDAAPKQDATGTIVDQSTVSKEIATTPPTETTPTEKPTEEKSLLNAKDEPKAEPVPEKYEPWTVPEGYTLDTAVVEEAAPLFKELGLSQAASQKLVDFYSKHALATYQQAVDSVTETNKAWAAETKAAFGNKLDEARSTVSKALGLLEPGLEEKFRSAMDETGMGNHPAFAQALHMLASKLVEGKHVAGSPPGAQTTKPRSAAAALYPNLP